MVSSNLTSQPDWLETFPTESPAYGFDEGGMWFSGDSSAVYPVRTNYDIDSEMRCDVIFTFTYNDVDEGCPDHGICFFKADTEPYWSWGNNVSRIAVQYDCGSPEIAGINGSAGSEYRLTPGQTYTARVIYWPEHGNVTAELYEGVSIEGTLVDQIYLNERLETGAAYRVGFDADLDSGLPDKAYFTYVELSVDPPPGQATRVFRSIHLPRRRRDAENAVDGAPINVQPGELIYDYEQNKLYAGQDDESVLQIGGGPGSANQSLNTTDSVTFNSVALPNGTQITVGSFDNMTGGQNGIALHCYVGYELNWQGGRLRSVYIGDTSGAPQPINCDSPLWFYGNGPAEMRIDGAGLTFPDGTTQTTASDPRWGLFLAPAPDNLAATPGDQTVSLTWSAPTVAAQTPITNYAVQFSDNNGVDWTSAERAPSTDANQTVVGLSNGVAYVFRVAGINGVGQGPWSPQSASVTPAV